MLPSEIDDGYYEAAMLHNKLNTYKERHLEDVLRQKFKQHRCVRVKDPSRGPITWNLPHFHNTTQIEIGDLTLSYWKRGDTWFFQSIPECIGSNYLLADLQEIPIKYNTCEDVLHMILRGVLLPQLTKALIRIREAISKDGLQLTTIAINPNLYVAQIKIQETPMLLECAPGGVYKLHHKVAGEPSTVVIRKQDRTHRSIRNLISYMLESCEC